MPSNALFIHQEVAQATLVYDPDLTYALVTPSPVGVHAKDGQTADNRNMIFFIASLPRRDQVDGRLPWNAYNNNLKTITEKLGISMLSMLEPLQKGYEAHNTKLFIPWDGHNSKIANQIIAQEITKEMLRQLKKTVIPK